MLEPILYNQVEDFNQAASAISQVEQRYQQIYQQFIDNTGDLKVKDIELLCSVKDELRIEFSLLDIKMFNSTLADWNILLERGKIK